jgi:hypothetical protein
MKERVQRFAIYTFDELVQYGKEHSDNIDPNSGIPWSFDIGGYPVTHENDSCYIIFINEPLRFTIDDILVFGVQDEPYIIKTEDANIGQFKN